MTKDFFDFADLSDLPEELRGKLTRETDEAVKAWAGIVQQGVARGYDALNINQIVAVAHRMGVEVPGMQTVRGYLKRAIELKLIGKPTPRSYGAPGVVVAGDDEDEADAAPEVATNVKDAAPAAQSADDVLNALTA
jgi:hypothetical protein